MCGIAGVYNLDQDSEPVSLDLLRRMCDVMAHRGPDDAGYLLVGDSGSTTFGEDAATGAHAPDGPAFLGLGHRRLSIIDLAGGHQPMSDASTRAWIVFNGEIYNYRELRSSLRAAGQFFRTQSDTEVVLGQYLHDGLAAIPKLNGLFAFALWDSVNRRLVLARDRLGTKPLYYATHRGRLIFASEIKAILAAGVPAALHYPALAEHFTFQNTLGDRTFFEGIRLLPPGHLLVSTGGMVHRTSYWDLVYSPEESDLSEQEQVGRLRGLFRQAVERQLVSDVPLGSFLSGGMDTGSITAIAAPKIQPLHTFTCGFDVSRVSEEERHFDESAHSFELSRLLETEHHIIWLDRGDMLPVVPRLMWHLEEPKMGISYQNYYAARLARDWVTVVLSGVGGDELFGGYPWRYRPIAECESETDFNQRYYSIWERMVPEAQHAQLFSEDTLRQLQDFSPRASFHQVMDHACSADLVHRAMYFDAKTFLSGLLIVEDKISMAHSLESRVPFTDNELIDFVATVPSSHKVNGCDSKVILKQAMKGLLPEATLRRRKIGFTPPEESWFRQGQLDAVRGLLLGKTALERGYFRPEFINQILDEHRAGTANHRFLIWSLVCFEWWNRLFLDGVDPPGAESGWERVAARPAPVVRR